MEQNTFIKESCQIDSKGFKMLVEIYDAQDLHWILVFDKSVKDDTEYRARYKLMCCHSIGFHILVSRKLHQPNAKHVN